MWLIAIFILSAAPLKEVFSTEDITLQYLRVYLDESKAFGQINHNNSISDKDLALVFASNCKLDGAGVYLHLF